MNAQFVFSGAGVRTTPTQRRNMSNECRSPSVYPCKRGTRWQHIYLHFALMSKRRLTAVDSERVRVCCEYVGGNQLSTMVDVSLQVQYIKKEQMKPTMHRELRGTPIFISACNNHIEIFSEFLQEATKWRLQLTVVINIIKVKCCQN